MIVQQHPCELPQAACLPCLPAARELAVIGQQYPFELPAFKKLRLTFAEGIKLLQENGYPDVRLTLKPLMGTLMCVCWAHCKGGHLTYKIRLIYNLQNTANI